MRLTTSPPSVSQLPRKYGIIDSHKPIDFHGLLSVQTDYQFESYLGDLLNSQVSAITVNIGILAQCRIMFLSLMFFVTLFVIF
jgi:hypothetical protein